MRRTFLPLVCTVVVSLFVGCSTNSDIRESSTPSLAAVNSGPMKSRNAHGYVISIHQGKTFTDGFESLEVTGDQPAVIRNVEIVGDEGLELAGVELAGPGRKVQISNFRMFPPKDRELERDLVVPAIGAVIEPGPPGWQLLIGIRVTGEGYLVRDTVRVTYEVDGTEYVWEQVASVAVCTSREVENKWGCPIAKNW